MSHWPRQEGHLAKIAPVKVLPVLVVMSEPLSKGVNCIKSDGWTLSVLLP